MHLLRAFRLQGGANAFELGYGDTGESYEDRNPRILFIRSVALGPDAFPFMCDITSQPGKAVVLIEVEGPPVIPVADLPAKFIKWYVGKASLHDLERFCSTLKPRSPCYDWLRRSGVYIREILSTIGSPDVSR